MLIALIAFTEGHPVPTTTRFWLSALSALGGLATRGVAQDDGFIFSGLEDGPKGMYAMAFSRDEGRLALAWI